MSLEKTLVDRLKQEFPDAEVLFYKIDRSNGTYRGLIVRMPGISAAPVINFDKIQEYAEKNFKSKGAIVNFIIDFFREAFREVPKIPKVSAEYIMENSFWSLINKEKSKAMLETVPYMDFHDLAMVPYFAISEDDKTSSFACITNKVLDHFDINKYDLFEACTRNTKPKVINASDVLLRTAAELSVDLGESINELSDLKFKYCTNQFDFRGAAAFLYPGVLKDVAEEWDDDVIIIPSSIHEVLLIPASLGTIDKIIEMIKSVNMEVVNADDFLSDHCYVYHKATGLYTLEG